jgi:two-component system, chemotaxis family, response regulator Rcp1
MKDPVTERLILVVEDNSEHLRQIEASFRESQVPHRLVAIANGHDAMNFLYRRGDYSDALRPDLILLDLNLPGKDGREILAEIKSDRQLRRIPIVILTTSNNTADISKSYTLQGNCYVIKSSDLEQLFQLVKRIEEFWLGIVTLPIE